MKSISTKLGDSGETGLLFGGRVSKSDPRVEAYGIADTAISALGVARATIQDAFVAEVLLDAQRGLFKMNAQLATDLESTASLESHFETISQDDIETLDELLDKLESDVQLPPSFIIPGASTASAGIDLARTYVRTVERRVVELDDSSALDNPHMIPWLNRLSDCLFMLARYVDRELPHEILTGVRRARE